MSPLTRKKKKAPVETSLTFTDVSTRGSREVFVGRRGVEHKVNCGFFGIGARVVKEDLNTPRTKINYSGGPARGKKKSDSGW